MYAIVEIAGKQYKIKENDALYVPRLKTPVGDTVTFDRVLLLSNEGDVTVGTPVVEGASVEAEVLEHVKADKVIVFKKKRRKGYRVKRGHRQPYTHISIHALATGGSVPHAESMEDVAEEPVVASIETDTPDLPMEDAS